MISPHLRAILVGIVSLAGVADAIPKTGGSFSHFNRPVRVLLMKGGREASVSSAGGALYFKERDSAQWRAVPSPARITATSDHRVRVGPFESDGHVLYLRGGRTPREPFQFAGRLYRGALKAVNRDGRLDLANVISLDDYVEGILPFEMSPTWELEALKAQAVASRSYALYRMQHPRGETYDVEPSVNDQVYGGATEGHDRVVRAIEETRGEYLPFRVYFHSRCGGRTDGARDVWSESGPRAGTKPCPSCWGSQAPAWHLEMPRAAFLEKLGLSPSDSLSLTAGDVTPSGRWVSLRVRAGGETMTLGAEKLRERLGYGKLKSTLFDWSLHEDTLHFDGRGAGHGVGLCQWGMRALARRGRDYRQILRHYYPDAEIRLISSDAPN